MQGAPEEHGRLCPLEVGAPVEPGPGTGDDLDRIDELSLALCADDGRHLRVGRARHRDRSRPHPRTIAFVQEQRAGVQVVHAAEVGPVPEGPGHRRDGHPEHALDLVHEGEGIATGLVQLVDEGQHRHTPGTADLEQLQRLRFDAFRRVDHHDHAVDRQERAVRVLAEVLVAGRVEQGDVVAAKLELDGGGADGDAALLFELHPVAGRMATRLAPADGARQLDRPGVQQQLLGQRRLAGVGMGDDGERASACHFATHGVAVDTPVIGEHGTGLCVRLAVSATSASTGSGLRPGSVVVRSAMGRLPGNDDRVARLETGQAAALGSR